MRAKYMTDATAAEQKPHGTENRFERVDVDQHNDARHKRGHIFESREESFDIVGDLLRSDHEHGDRERKCCVDESFQPRHRNATQAKSA